VLARLMPLTEHLVGKLLEADEMSLSEALSEIRNFEAASLRQEFQVEAEINRV
jgi:cell division protease FtsH